MTADDLLLQAGKLSQRCPACGIVEAAGPYCTACLTRTGSADWFSQGRGRPRSVARKPPENGINRGSGRPRGPRHRNAA